MGGVGRERTEYAHSFCRRGGPEEVDSKHSALAHICRHLNRRCVDEFDLCNWLSGERLFLLKKHDELVTQLCRGGHRHKRGPWALLSQLKRTIVRDEYISEVDGFALWS